MVPKIANQTKKANIGANNTPPINSLILRPLEILVIKVATNRSQAIHQA